MVKILFLKKFCTPRAKWNKKISGDVMSSHVMELGHSKGHTGHISTIILYCIKQGYSSTKRAVHK